MLNNKGYERGEEPITSRAADVLEPELEKAMEDTKGIARDIGDTLIYAIYPTTGMRFLRWKYGLEEPPPETRAKTLDDVKREDELISRAKQGKLFERAEAPSKGPGIRTFHIYVDDEYYKVELEAEGAKPEAAAPRVIRTSNPATRADAKAEPVAVAAGEAAIHAPMPGMIIRYEVNEGDRVKAGDTIVIVEAMKMETPLTSPIDGMVKSIAHKKGDSVAKGELLAIIAPD